MIDAPDATDIPDPTDRLYEMSHAWALRTASLMRIDAVMPPDVSWPAQWRGLLNPDLSSR